MRSGIRVLAIVALGVGGFLALEVGLRLLTDYDSRWNIRLGASRRFDPVTQFRSVPNHTFNSGAATNEDGYLAPRRLEHAKPDGALRFIYLGDSVSFLPTGENFPRQTEAMLEADWGVEVQTINTAVPGFASHNARAMFESEVSAYDADYLIVSLGWNDLGQFGPEGLPFKRRAKGYEVSPLQRVLTHVFTVRLFYQLERMVQRRRSTLNEPLSERELALYDDYYPAHYYDNLRAILRLAKSRYPHVYLTTLGTVTSDAPTPSEMAKAHFPVGMGKNLGKLHRLVGAYNQVVRTLSREEGVGLVDFYAAMNSREARRTFTDSCHVNPEGAAILARRIVARIDSDRRAAAAP